MTSESVGSLTPSQLNLDNIDGADLDIKVGFILVNKDVLTGTIDAIINIEIGDGIYQDVFFVEKVSPNNLQQVLFLHKGSDATGSVTMKTTAVTQ